MYVCCKDKTPTDPYVSNRVGYEQRVVIRNNREDDKRGCVEEKIKLWKRAWAFRCAKEWRKWRIVSNGTCTK